MNSVWLNLMWKEWREHRWKLAALCVVNVAVPALLSIRYPEVFFAAATATLVFSVPLASMFVGMGIAAGEQSRGTIRFLQALPTPMMRPAVAKLSLAAVAVTLPILLAIVVSALWTGFFASDRSFSYDSVARDLSGRIWSINDVRVAVVVAGASAALSFLAWMAAAGVNRSDEIRAGAVGMLTIAAVWAVIGFVQTKITRGGSDEPPQWFRVATAAAPGGGVAVQDNRLERGGGWWRTYLPYVLAAVASNGAMAGWFVLRFGRVVAGKRQPAKLVRQAERNHSWLGPPRRFPLTAILWKQCRETLPLAAMGAGTVLCLSLLIGPLVGTSGATARLAAREIVDLSVGVWIIIGVFVAIVAGLGLLMEDLRPGLNQFWRSRPIDVNQWFVLKFLTSLTSTVAILALPPLAMTGLMSLRYGGEIELARQFPQFGVILSIQIGAFCAAAAAMALVRQPIYAAILALGAIAAAGVVADWLSWRDVAQPIIVATVVWLPAAAAVVLAWLAVRFDWGWQP